MRLNLPQFLFLNGPPGSGKSTLAKLICAEQPAAFRESFAEPIREMLWGVFFPEYMLDKPFDLRDGTIKAKRLGELARLYPEDHSKVPPVTVRDAMIGFSEDYMKSLFGKDIFGRLLWSRACEQTAFYNHFVIDDAGFTDEVAHIVHLAGSDNCHLVRLHRRGCNFSGDSRSYLSLPRVQTLDLHNDGAPDEMLASLQLELGNL